MRRLQVLAVLLLALLVLDECLGSYQKSSKENKKKKNKAEGEAREAKKKYSESASKQHKKKVREAPVETESNEEDVVGEIDVQETYKNKNSKKKYNKEIKATKYGKKDKLKSLEDDLYVAKGKESKVSKKTKERKQRRAVEEVVEEEPIDGEGEENALCSQQCQVEEADAEAEVATVPAKKTPRIHRYIVEEEILDGEESDITEDEEETWERPSPRSAKCSLK